MQKYCLCGIQTLDSGTDKGRPNESLVYWLNLLERDGWLVVNIEGRKLGVVISVTEAGREHLRVAGYHLGETRYVGERQNILSVKIERIPESLREAFSVMVRNALPVELRGLPISFL